MREISTGMGPLAWRKLGETEFSAVWEAYCNVPKPGTATRTFRIPDAFDERHPDVQPVLAEFHRTLLRAFRDCLPRGRKMYALDYHHPSFEFDPHVPFDVGTPDVGRWPVSVVPDGDDTLYVADDFSFGTISAWSPPSLILFGTSLLDRLDLDRPRLLDRWQLA